MWDTLGITASLSGVSTAVKKLAGSIQCPHYYSPPQLDETMGQGTSRAI